MIISVLFENKTYGVVKKGRIAELINSGKITKFFRSSGWVTIGVDPMRKADYGHLEERRQTVTLA